MESGDGLNTGNNVTTRTLYNPGERIRPFLADPIIIFTTNYCIYNFTW